ncbi:MAG: TlpA family protein disulfide reductase [Bacteroidales bacterium]|nr:TlpA family protein disulfide reductase [Bacteroidales bacterium]
MNPKKIAIRLGLGFLSILIIIFLILFTFDGVIRIDNVTTLDWIPIFSCSIAYLIAGIITSKVPIKFLPILIIPLYLFVLMGFGDILVILILFAIGSVLVTRDKIKKLYKILILIPMLAWFLFCLISEPLVIKKYHMIEVKGKKNKTQYGQIVVWNFNGNKPQKIPDIKLLDTNNAEISLNQFKGKKIFITFWSTSCGPCIEDKPKLEEIKSALKEHPEIIFIDISIDKDFERWKAYIDDKNPQGIQLIINENARKISKIFKCGGIPFGVIVDSNGNFTANYLFRPQVIDIIGTMKELK